MNEPTRTMFGDLAIAGGVALAVGVLVACASWPLVKWLEDRRSDKVAGKGQSAGFLPPVTAPPSGFDEQVAYVDDEIARTARRIIEAQGLVP